MTTQLHAEWIKLRSTRLVHGLAAAHVTVTVLQVVLIFVNAGRLHTPSLGTTESILRLIAASSYGSYVALVLGVLLVAGEHRHQTITSTYITQPARRVVLGAKAVLAGASAAAIAAAGLAVTATVSVGWLSLNEVALDLGHGRYATALLGTIAVSTVYGLLGVGLGALLPNAAAAIGVVVGYGLIVENLLVGLALPNLMQWLPGGAATALVGARQLASGPVAPAQAAAVLLAYGVALLALGFAATSHRDVL